jgi:hypothetical protein
MPPVMVGGPDFLITNHCTALTRQSPPYFFITTVNSTCCPHMIFASGMA